MIADRRVFRPRASSFLRPPPRPPSPLAYPPVGCTGRYALVDLGLASKIALVTGSIGELGLTSAEALERERAPTDVLMNHTGALEPKPFKDIGNAQCLRSFETTARRSRIRHGSRRPRPSSPRPAGTLTHTDGRSPDI